MEGIATAPIVGRHYDGAPLRIGHPINVANPAEKTWRRHRYLFAFGAIGSTFVLAYGDCLSDALEEAAAFLADKKLWGHITPHSEGVESLCCDCENPFDCDSHTYTESGWLTSWEWFAEEDPSDERLREVNRG